MNRELCIILAMALSTTLNARVPHKRIVIPDTKDYLVLKCDFHVHTLFSDASVWPSVRVQEAAMEGLDAIAITDHIEHRPHSDVVVGDHNRSFEIANKSSKKEGVLVIKGSEITRGMPPGHWNALFLNDSEKLVKDDVNDAFKEARKQGAFIFWNHPGWERQAPNKTVWLPEHEQLYQAGNMMGIEVYNMYGGYYPEAFAWALERNLAIMCDTDCHAPMDQLIEYEAGEHRPITLVFAKERTVASIKEALMAKRTAAFADRNVYGRREMLQPLFESVLVVESVDYKDKRVSVTFRNNSTIPVYIRKGNGSEDFMYERYFQVRPNEVKALVITPIGNISFDALGKVTVNVVVENFFVAPEEPMTYRFTFQK